MLKDAIETTINDLNLKFVNLVNDNEITVIHPSDIIVVDRIVDRDALLHYEVFTDNDIISKELAHELIHVTNKNLIGCVILDELVELVREPKDISIP